MPETGNPSRAHSPVAKVEEQSKPLQPAGCSDHATKDATITSRLNQSEALQYRHLMLKSLLYQRRGVRYIAVIAKEQVFTACPACPPAAWHRHRQCCQVSLMLSQAA